MDAEIAEEARRLFERQGLQFRLGSRVTGARVEGDHCVVECGDAKPLDCTRVLLAVGRRPMTEGLGLESVGIALDEGRIPVDERFATVADAVYAIGDVIRGPMLAHKAQEEGIACAETIAGAPTHPIDPELIPGATFCHPQVASVGMTEQQAKDAGKDVKVGRFKLGAVGASAVYDDREGVVKIVADAEYGEIVGAHIVGNRACDMISELVDTIALEGGYQELARIIHPHPTISEAILDAARAVDGWATHA